MSSRQKRPVAADSNRPRKRQQTAKAAENDDDSVYEIARALLQARPTVTRHDIENMPGLKAVSRLSSESDDEEAVRLFQESVELESINAFNESAQKFYNFRLLWRTCLRVLHVPPNCMLAPHNLLQYGTNSSKFDKALFGSDFSKLLASLVVHPVWDQDFALFRLALQFVVKCRIGHRGVWPHEKRHAASYRTLELLRQMLDQSRDGPEAISDMLTNAIDETESFEEFPAFLLTIADYVREEQVPDLESYTQCHGVFALPVLMKDLKSVEKALDNYPWADVSWRTTTERIWAAFKAERGPNTSELPSSGQWKPYLSSCQQFIFRGIVYIKRNSRDGEDGGQEDVATSPTLPLFPIDDGSRGRNDGDVDEDEDEEAIGSTQRQGLRDRIGDATRDRVSRPDKAYADLKLSHEELQRSHEELQRSHTDLASRYEASNTESIKRFEALESGGLNTTHNAASDELQEQNASLVKELSEAKRKITSFEKHIASLEKGKAESEKDKADSEKQIASLNEQNASLNGQVTSMREKMTSMKEKMTSLQALLSEHGQEQEQEPVVDGQEQVEEPVPHHNILSLPMPTLPESCTEKPQLKHQRYNVEPLSKSNR